MCLMGRGRRWGRGRLGRDAGWAGGGAVGLDGLDGKGTYT